jgi:hypothetical protein
MLNQMEIIMAHHNEFSGLGVSGPGAQSLTVIAPAKVLPDVGGERRQEDISRLQTDDPLSADDVDEQIRLFFARGLA